MSVPIGTPLDESPAGVADGDDAIVGDAGRAGGGGAIGERHAPRAGGRGFG